MWRVCSSSPSSEAHHKMAAQGSQGDDDVWRRLANEISRGAEYDSHERRPFSQCLPETRVELLDTLEASLIQQDNKLVWLFGGSGSGKSSAAYSTAERLRSKDQLAATFFFSRKDVFRSSADRVFLTIAYQIGLLHHRARSAIAKAIKHDPDLLSPQKSRREQFNKLVATPLRELHILCTSRTTSHLQALTKRQDIIGLVTPLHIEAFDATEDIKLYLRCTFHEIYHLRDLEFVHSLPWPTDHILSSLVDRIKGHFIVAATICRLVRDASDPTNCLSVISSIYTGEIDSLDLTLGSVDSVYHYIIASCDPQDQHSGVLCLSDIISLASPLSLSDICKLFAADIRKRVAHLSAIVYIPPMDSPNSVQIYHTSLRDYLSTSSRSGNFHVDPAESHRRLTGFCLRLMRRELKRDICGLNDPSRAHVEIPEFERKREAAISGALRYACLYWPYHLERMGQSSENQVLLVHFLQEQLLLFIEALSLMGCLDLAAIRLTDASRVVSMWGSSHERDAVLELLYDAWRLVSQFFEPIRDSALHLYESALPMCPLDTRIRRTYQGVLAGSAVLIKHGIDDRWDSVLRTINMAVETGVTRSVANSKMSPDGGLLVTVSGDGDVELWDHLTGLLLEYIFHVWNSAQLGQRRVGYAALKDHRNSPSTILEARNAEPIEFPVNKAQIDNFCTSRDMTTLAYLDEKELEFHLYNLADGRSISDIAFDSAATAVRSTK
ncbi:hypothetical protein CONPUDRAFT_167380 [Coniophora puteana RWD-64-598 SS2]|uniref:Nephrocystin 3-like N-terminal domain-containing protein n=1 Tax=Coniophora puteana (strain RWD-64-598) TaxID=741705 RepID=A0A5M3MH70_CONPW|nr:uncharacterized protein CONPUDRAFT_167380 [Coniophora puteana RWD-64-598 SS2]EIW78356.1 hypothetical protein CONPUDRAFT_167380 [Coniophora puteana RWD-64-598 SS2]